MGEDFEWKLHEIEKEYKEKLKHSKEKIDDQIRDECIGILKEKDEEMNKELKGEKEALKKALESVTTGGATDQALQVMKKDMEHQIVNKTKKWEEKKRKYHKDIEELRRKLKEKEDALDKQSSQLVANNTQTSNETLIFEERKKAEKMATKYQEDHDKLKDELTAEMSRLRAEYDEKNYRL